MNLVESIKHDTILHLVKWNLSLTLKNWARSYSARKLDFFSMNTHKPDFMAVRRCCSPPSGLPNRHDLLPLLLLPLPILHLATTMHGCMSVSTLSASVDSAGYVPSLARPVLCPTPSVHAVCRQHRYIMMNVVPLLGQTLQMFTCTFFI